MRYGFINNFSQVLAADLAAGATTMTLDGGGALLSAATVDFVYTLTLVEKDGDGVEIGWEVVYVTGATGNDLTIEKGKEGTADAEWPTGTTVEMRVTAWALGAAVYTDSSNNTIGLGASVTGATDGVALGPSALVTANSGVALGDSAESLAPFGFALGPYAVASGEDSVAIGYASASGEHAVCIGESTEATGQQSTLLGAMSWAYGDYSLALGERVEANSDYTTAIGSGAVAGVSLGDPTTDGIEATALGSSAVAYGNGATALGSLSDATSNLAVSLGYGARAEIEGGLRISALSYLPKNPVPVAALVSAPTAVPRSSQQVVIATDPLSLTDNAATVTLDQPAGTRLFIDSIDVVIVGSDTPGGTPEISVGPDDVTPSAYLASAAVTKTAVGERQTHTPLVADGVTSLRVATTVAGTGTTYQAKIVFRGYVMEM